MENFLSTLKYYIINNQLVKVLKWKTFKLLITF